MEVRNVREPIFLPLILLFVFGGFVVLSAVLKALACVTVFSDVVLAVKGVGPSGVGGPQSVSYTHLTLPTKA